MPFSMRVFKCTCCFVLSSILISPRPTHTICLMSGRVKRLFLPGSFKMHMWAISRNPTFCSIQRSDQPQAKRHDFLEIWLFRSTVFPRASPIGAVCFDGASFIHVSISRFHGFLLPWLLQALRMQCWFDDSSPFLGPTPTVLSQPNRTVRCPASPACCRRSAAAGCAPSMIRDDPPCLRPQHARLKC